MGTVPRAEPVNADPVSQQLQAISDAIQAASATVDEGGAVDLTALEEAVGLVCNDIAKSPPIEGLEKIEEVLIALVAALDGLSHALTDQHKRMAAGEGLNTAAQTAYANTAGRDEEDGDSS